jgi:alpha-L-fucosidase
MTNKAIIAIFILALFHVNFFAQKTVDGNEQGMEIGKLDLHQDSVAVKEALTGWWKNSRQTLDERMSWFDEAKFGCFVHWGVYSSAGGEWNGKAVNGYAEHLMRIRKIPLAEYKEKLVYPFNPVAFNADEWMRTAKEAGMRYFIITAKHHDGFAMYFSDAYPYDMRLTKYNRDPMKELRDAARKYGLKFGFYYSHAFDWEHPDAPGNDWDYDNPGGDKLLYGANWWNNYPIFLPHAEKYVTEKSIPQIIELIQKYQPDILWFDTPHKLPLYENIRILKAIREIAPDIVVNGRLARFTGMNLGDYLSTGDRAAYFFPVKDDYWESIPTTNESYGYSKHDKSHKSPAHFIRLLSSAAAKGGNILMNVGPMGTGKWDETDVQIFKKVGEWLKVNGVSIYGTERSPLPIQNWGVVTKKEHTFYLHIHQYPKNGKLIVGGLHAKVKRAQMISTGEKLKWKQLDKDLQINLPAVCPDTANTVIALSVDEYTIYPERLLDPYATNNLLVFDSKFTGDFIPGDGKVYRNYFSNWKNNNQTISWEVRLLQPATFNISLEFNKDKPSDAGVVALEIDGKIYEVVYSAHAENRNSEKLNVAVVNFSKGKHTIVLKGIRYTGSQYMRPINLIVEQKIND